MSATTRPPLSPATTPLYDGYATIRSRGLYRSRSIRAAELEAELNGTNTNASNSATDMRRPALVERRRTLSLKSDYSQCSCCSGNSGICQNAQRLGRANSTTSGTLSATTPSVAEEIYASRPVAKAVKAPKIGDMEPLYASTHTRAAGFRPLSNASSSSGGGGSNGGGCRDSAIDSTGSGSIAVEYHNMKKNSRFSLDSLQSSATPKTPDYTAVEDENIFLYTAPESPKRRLDSTSTRHSYGDSERCYSPISTKNSFEIQDITVHSGRISGDFSPSKLRRSSTRSNTSNTSSHYSRTKSLIESSRPSTLMTNSYHRSESESPTYAGRPALSPNAPPTPVRRESLYAKPKIYAMYTPTVPPTPTSHSRPTSPCQSPTKSPLRSLTNSTTYQPQLPALSTPQRSTSAEILERSHTSHSLNTIDQDDMPAVPNAMPVLQNAVDRRYHTLGHMRVQSMGTGLYRSYDSSPMGSMLNMMGGVYYSAYAGRQHHSMLHTNKSAGNIYASADDAVADLNRLAPEYIDPLDFKIGCQTTLRSKPVIPWYELAIKRDLKRQSCPPITGSGLTNGSNTLSMSRSTDNKAHVVAAFEQSLSNMTSRLQHLTATAERKDGELTDMRQTIELLRKQSIQAGLTSAHMQSMGVQTQQNEQQQLGRTAITQQPMSNQNGASNGTASSTPSSTATGVMQRHHSSDSMCSLNSISSGCSTQDKKQKKKGWLRSSFTKAFSRNAKISKTSRHVGHHHVGGTGSSNPGIGVHATPGVHAENSAAYNKANGHSHADAVVGLAALATQPPPPLPTANASPTKGSPAKTVTLIDNAKPIDAIDHDDHQVVEDLKKQLREKDLVLTDIRLEALSSASQLESLKDTVNKMRAEMMSLKQNNERLQKLVTSRSLAGSEASLGNAISPSGSIGESRRYSLADGNARPPMELPKRLEEEVEEENIPPAPAPEPPPPPLSPATHIDLTPPPPALNTIPSPAHIAAAAVEELPDVTDGKKIAIACYLGQPESFVKYCEEMLEADEFYANGVDADGISERKSFPTASLNEFVVAYTYISGKTTWQNLDYIVRKTFKDYVSRIDPGTNLGLNTDSITSYHLGEAKRGPEMGFPELLPCGYIIGNVRTLYICLQGVGSLAFDSLIPRSIVHRYISLLTEHRRLILCGPSGTGKSYLARRLAEFLVARSGRGNPSETIATFNVDHKSSKELRQYLGHVAEQAAIANGASELPSVIILDNLHHASALGDVFSCLLSAGPAGKLPCIIGTMSQATCNTTNLQLHHNFRWVLTANHMEPVKGFLGRFLRRRLFQLELQTGHPQPELSTVLAWLPSVWQHINRFLEAHSSSDVTIGPRLFLACPLDLKDSQVWFTDIWNYHLSPYLVEAVREGVQLYGRRGGAWNDPSIFIRNSYPWPYGPDSVPPLRQINAEDVGLEGVAASNGDNPDPLLNMLMRLQEAANYSENQDQESDCASLDSNVTPDSSAGAE
ncbi:protein sickie [Anastrepha ludens]|uniref:protein sickie n=1 Tax=Anastrepha ludens TaxID=28586 RepID=UPI0023AFFE3D|nr:protein sickie [Anastrepha ludens]XP_053961472.1 protein sickie [Anastrepha ludens]XP_053961473.1 protein sickie [Anastrepha ludens]XP_053961474.1 protein sickie [Anastrepha ludens]XP_053961475.1 protein sickie [Anastrepha ludens]